MLLVQKLRHFTNDYHKQLDQHDKLSIITSSQVELEDYKAYLQLFHKIHAEIEPILVSHLNEKFPFLERVAMLESELDYFDLNPYESEDRFSFSSSNSEAIGAYYVLEGSRLGGKFIANHLKDVLDLTDYSFPFLKQSTHYSWKNVMNLINGVDEQEHENVILGAECTFCYILKVVNSFHDKKSKKNSESFHR
jgi:heme oxygenase